MKTLSFTITIEYNQYGAENVPYIRHLLGNIIPSSVGTVRSLEYMGEVDTDRCEAIEYDAYIHGEMELQ